MKKKVTIHIPIVEKQDRPRQKSGRRYSLLLSTLAGIVFAGLFSTSVFVFATPPGSQYSPGDTLNPSCAVGSANCSIIPPVPYTGASSALNLGAQNFLTSGTTTLGAQTNVKYDASNYSTLTASSNGDLTIATTSATTGGNININSAIAGDFTLLSNSGTLVLGGSGNTNNENLKFDFETNANKVNVTSTTGVTDIDLGSLNLITTGNLTMGGSTTNTLVTRIKAGVPTESDANGALVIDSTNGGLYFRYNNAWHYTAITAGFQVPNTMLNGVNETDGINIDDLVIGKIDSKMESGALHGHWVTLASVKADLLAELKGEISGSSAPVNNNSSTAQKTARLEGLEMVDRATKDVYCTWIENGEWQKAKGGCDQAPPEAPLSSPPVIDNGVTQPQPTPPDALAPSPEVTSPLLLPPAEPSAPAVFFTGARQFVTFVAGVAIPPSAKTMPASAVDSAASVLNLPAAGALVAQSLMESASISHKVSDVLVHLNLAFGQAVVNNMLLAEGKFQSSTASLLRK